MAEYEENLEDDEVEAFLRAVGCGESRVVNYIQFEKLLEPQAYTLPTKKSPSPQKKSVSRQPTQPNSQAKQGLGHSPTRSTSRFTLEGDLKYPPSSASKLSTAADRLGRAQNVSSSPFGSRAGNEGAGQGREVSFRQSASKLTPLRAEDELRLVQSLKSLVLIDREVESAKEQLALRRDFNLMDAFRIFDRKEVGHVFSIDLEMALNNIGIYFTPAQVVLLFKKMDKNSDGRITFSEFCLSVLPQSVEYAEIMDEKQPQLLSAREGTPLFEPETQSLFKSLFHKITLGEEEAEILRLQLNQRPKFLLPDAFDALDRDNNGFITINEFKGILNDHGFFVNQQDLQNLVERFDQDKDGKVSFDEFVSEMKPKSPVKSHLY